MKGAIHIAGPSANWSGAEKRSAPAKSGAWWNWIVVALFVLLVALLIVFVIGSAILTALNPEIIGEQAAIASSLGLPYQGLL